MVPGESATARLAARELTRGLHGLLGIEIPTQPRVNGNGAVLVGTPATSPEIARLGWDALLKKVGDAGYVIRTTQIDLRATVVIASGSEIGALYGVFHFLRLMQTGQPVASLAIEERPRFERRMLDHWDNLDGTIERGYAGGSLWNWDGAARTASIRATRTTPAPTRRSASTATVLNNVNANADSPDRAVPREGGGARRRLPALRHPRLPLGELHRAASLGGLATADPLDPAVAALVEARRPTRSTRLIPDFGGLPGQGQQRGAARAAGLRRTHADGANVLADAVAPHGGIVMWRAFVYSTRAWIRTASSGPTSSSCRSTASSATTCSCR